MYCTVKATAIAVAVEYWQQLLVSVNKDFNTYTFTPPDCTHDLTVRAEDVVVLCHDVLTFGFISDNNRLLSHEC